MSWKPSTSAASELHTGQVLIEEFDFIHGEKRRQDFLAVSGAREFADTAAGQESNDCQKEEARRRAQYIWAVSHLPGAGQTALCLSGGGIRSAAFGLGILQGLAERGLLAQFHYLSTVSGGGYIASWLTAWRCRRSSKGLGEIIEQLRTRQSVDTGEPEPLQRLRFNQNFLTPRVGVGSADTWTAMAMWVRNLLLNWVVFLPLLCALLLIPRFVQASMLWVRQQHIAAHSSLVALMDLLQNRPNRTPIADLGWWCWADSAAAFLVFIGLSVSVIYRPAGGHSGMTQRRFVLTVLLPMVAGSILLTSAAESLIGRPVDLAGWAILTATIYVAARGFGGLFVHARTPAAGAEAPESEPNSNSVALLEYAGWTIAGACTGLLIGGGLYLLQMPDSIGIAFGDWSDPEGGIIQLLCVIGPPWIMLAFLAGDAIYVGVTSRSWYGDRDREWLARSAGWFGAIAFAYLILFWIVLDGWYAAWSIFGYVALSTSGVLAVGGALMPFTRATAAATAKERLPVTNLVAVLSALFLVAGSAWMAEQSRLFTDYLRAQLFGQLALGREPLFLAGVAIVLFLLSMAFSSFVNVNWFSLHALYRNRLVRTFLGASNVASEPELEHRDRFDGFSLRDNLAMSDLRKGLEAVRGNDHPASVSLFPVLNMSVNILATKNLAWQERKAEPFISTPLHTGGHLVGYRNSREYMGGKTAAADESKTGITLGTAMAISGAAVSPNWGYHSSPLTSFLMMLFNVRLGWWLGNPTHPTTWKYRGPLSSWKLFVQEALGQTDDAQPWLYLSDGGHFENLGLYEMIRRRCRTIIVSDAGADPNCTLEDLGNAVRKVWIDLGVKIEFERITVRKRSDVASTGVYCAVGTIIYPGRCPGNADGASERGSIVYIKPGFYWDQEPADVRAYAAANAKFPHETTLNQWFGESQFESYRSLGAYVIEAISRSGEHNEDETVPDGSTLELAAFVSRARAMVESFQNGSPATVVEIRRPIELKPAA